MLCGSACPGLRRCSADAATKEPEDCNATGRQESVRRFIELYKRLWGSPMGRSRLEEVDDAVTLVRYKNDPRYFRPAEVETLLGDPNELGEAGLDPKHQP